MATKTVLKDGTVEFGAEADAPKSIRPAKKKNMLGKRETIEGWLMVIVPLLGFCAFTAFPIFMSFYVSFFDLHSYDLSNMVFCGFENYKKIFTMDLFYTALVNTIYFMLSVPINLVSQLFLANLLQKGINKHFSRIVTLILYIPTIFGGVAVALVWNWILEPNFGVFNSILAAMGLKKIGFTTTKEWFMPSVLLIKWWSAGMNIIIFQSALANVDNTLKEAARIDGASEKRIFFNIVIPQISPMLYYTMMTNFMAAAQEMATMQIIAGNGLGPDNSAVTISYLMYRMFYVTTYTDGFGVSSALGCLLGVAIILFYQLNNRLAKKWVSYD